MRIGARGGADAELELLRRRREAPGLVGAEAVLAGEDDGEAPAGTGVPSDAFGTLNVMKREIAVRDDRHRAERVAARVDVALAEALHLDQAAPRERRRDREVAQRVGAAVEVDAAPGTCT